MVSHKSSSIAKHFSESGNRSVTFSNGLICISQSKRKSLSMLNKSTKCLLEYPKYRIFLLLLLTITTRLCYYVTSQ